MTLAEEPAIIADDHPSPIEIESGRTPLGRFDLNLAAGLHRIDEETLDTNQSWFSEYRSTAPAAVVLAG